MVETFVAITAPTRVSEAGIERAVLDGGYLHGLRLAGLLPLMFSPLDDAATHSRLLERAGGLVLTGGEDVDPARYGEEVNGARKISPERDEMEFRLLETALERGLPVLAICRGMQLLNVALGGSLYQDLGTDFDASIGHDAWRELAAEIHAVRPEEPKLLHDVFGGEPTLQNSAHHQGVKRLAPSLTPVGFTADGLVEAVELRESGTAWTVGVQWHPERKLDGHDDVNRGLFHSFGRAVREAATPAAEGRGRMVR